MILVNIIKLLYDESMSRPCISGLSYNLAKSIININLVTNSNKCITSAQIK